MKEAVFIPGCPKPASPYSPAIRANGLVFVSGQIPLDPSTGRVVGDDIEVQTKQVMENLKRVLEAAGCTTDDVVKCTVFLADISLFARFNTVYGQYFGDPKPARTTVESGLLANCLVEVDAIATCAG